MGRTPIPRAVSAVRWFLVTAALHLAPGRAGAWCLPGEQPPVPRADPSTTADDVESRAVRLEAGGGLFSAIDADHRDRFGTEPRFSLALSAPLGESSRRAFLEVGYARGEGTAFGDPDPTFEERETSYWVAPILLGIRFDTAPGARRSPVGATLGLAFAMALVSVDTPFGPRKEQTGQGIAFDLRPEIDLGGPWRAWARAQMMLMTAVGGEQTAFPEINLAGSGLQVGLARDLVILGR